MRRQIAEGKVLRDPAVIPQTLAVANPFWDERTKTDGQAETRAVARHLHRRLPRKGIGQGQRRVGPGAQVKF
jgi:hypothetical protein